MQNNPATTSPPTTATGLNQVGFDVMALRDEVAKKAYFLHLDQARLQGRNMPVE
ncbi:MAG: hypothetical protein NT105_03480 [Verrucomicrobia bacterium]|nr:hypothetical protein [Verrucomicrobiota bacterium]